MPKQNIAAKVAKQLGKKLFNSTTNKLANQAANKALEFMGLSTAPKKLMPHELQDLLEQSVDKFELNSFSGRQFINDRVVSDITLTALKNKLSADHNLKLTKTDLREAVQLACHENIFSPVERYLTSLSWDGTDRIPALVSLLNPTFVNDKHEALVHKMLRCFLVSGVARTMQPGVKADNVLVFVGKQRSGKSSVFQTLASREWFRDSNFNIESRDGLQSLQGCFIYELAELKPIKDKDPDVVKSFLSSAVDTYRAPWAKQVDTFPRTCIFCATTNDSKFLVDRTGSARFWVIETGEIDLVKLALIRDQLWAEAVSLYNGGQPHWLNVEDTELSEEINKRYSV